MTGRAVSSVLAVIGILALSVTMAQAGGGQGTPASFNTFFECHSIDGGSAGEVVSTHVPDATSTLLNGNLRVGAAVLLCRQVDVKDAAGNFINGTDRSELKCYTVSAKGPKAASTQMVVEDDFVATETVNVSPAVQMICGPAGALLVP